MDLIKQYNKALQDLYDHVGFKEDWVVCPIDDKTDMVWSCDGENIKWAHTIEQFNSDGDYYTADVYTQRFYDKWVYEGKDLTMIFGDPHTDGVQWFYVFANKNRIPAK